MGARFRLFVPLALGAAAFVQIVAACTGDDPLVGGGGGTDGGDNGEAAPPAPPSSVDAAGDGSMGMDAGPDAPFSPADFGARLVLWYEASPKNLVLSDAGDGTVVQWNDLSSAHLDATKLPGPNSSSGETSMVDDAGTVLRNVVDFTVGTQKLGNGTGQLNLEFGPRDFLVVVVLSMDRGATTVDAPLFERHESFGQKGQLAMYASLGHVKVDLGPDDPDAASIEELVSTNAVLDDHAYHVVAMRRVHQAALPKDTIQIRIDGVHEEQSFDPVDLDLSNANFWFGGDYGGFGPVPVYDLRIAETIAIASKTSTPVTDDEVKALEAYLKAKYATP